MRRLAPLLFFYPLFAFGLAGCPRDVQAPPPGDAIPCASIEECNAGRTCGDLVLCVGGFCEATPSHVVPCRGEGVPIP